MHHSISRTKRWRRKRDVGGQLPVFEDPSDTECHSYRISLLNRRAYSSTEISRIIINKYYKKCKMLLHYLPFPNYEIIVNKSGDTMLWIDLKSDTPYYLGRTYIET